VMCSSLSSFLHGMLHMVYNCCLIWSAKIQASIWIIFCTLETRGIIFAGQVEEEADEVKEGAEEDKKEACVVLCYFLLCQLDLFVLFFSCMWVLCCITQLVCRCLCYTFSAVWP
jgi:hypothetical protein